MRVICRCTLACALSVVVGVLLLILSWSKASDAFGAPWLLWIAIGIPASTLELLAAFPFRKLVRLRKLFEALEFLSTVLAPPALGDPARWRRLEDAVRCVHWCTNIDSAVGETADEQGSTSTELEVLGA